MDKNLFQILSCGAWKMQRSTLENKRFSYGCSLTVVTVGGKTRMFCLFPVNMTWFV